MNHYFIHQRLAGKYPNIKLMKIQFYSPHCTEATTLYFYLILFFSDDSVSINKYLLASLQARQELRDHRVVNCRPKSEQRKEG